MDLATLWDVAKFLLALAGVIPGAWSIYSFLKDRQKATDPDQVQWGKLALGALFFVIGSVFAIIIFVMPAYYVQSAIKDKGPLIPPAFAQKPAEKQTQEKGKDGPIGDPPVEPKKEWPSAQLNPPPGAMKTAMADQAPGIAKPRTSEEPAAAAKLAFWPLFNGTGMGEWTGINGKELNASRQHNKGNTAIISVGNTFGSLFSRRNAFADFHIRLEMRSREGLGGYPSIMLRREALVPGSPDIRGYDLTFFIDPPRPEKPSVALYLDNRASTLRQSELAAAIVRGEWFKADIVASGGSLSVNVNGVPTLIYNDKVNRYRSGGFWLHGGDFRRIEITEFPFP